MRFFTYDYGNWNKYLWPYLIVKLKNYLKHPKKERYKTILIDPGVYELGDSDSYSWEGTINIQKFLDSLPNNHYFSCDYPGDMNPQYTNLFLHKSWDNACKFSKHKQYITTVQYQFNNYLNFTEWFKEYNELPMKSGIIGIGNMCQQKGLNSFVKHAIPYVIKNSNADWIHFYGPNLRIIKYIAKWQKLTSKLISVDNRKWEFYVKSSERPQAFKDYVIKLEEFL